MAHFTLFISLLSGVIVVHGFKVSHGFFFFFPQLMVGQNTFSDGQLLFASSSLIPVHMNFRLVKIKYSEVKLGRQALYMEFIWNRVIYLNPRGLTFT